MIIYYYYAKVWFLFVFKIINQHFLFLKMIFEKNRIILSTLVLVISSTLPINNSRANIFERFFNNKFLGEWCSVRIKFGGEVSQIEEFDFNRFCMTFRKDNTVFIESKMPISGISNYKVVDEKNIVIIPLNGAPQVVIKYNKNRNELNQNVFGIGEIIFKREK